MVVSRYDMVAVSQLESRILIQGDPWPTPWYPPWHILLIPFEFVSESLYESGLFGLDEVDVIDKETGCKPNQYRKRVETYRLTKQDKQDTQYHRIPHVAIWSDNDHMLGRAPRCQRSFPNLIEQVNAFD